jgi:hypothetical protein
MALLINGQEVSMCACMGPIGDDPHCPCKMQSLGLEPTPVWTPESTAQFHAALREVFDMEQTQ